MNGLAAWIPTADSTSAQVAMIFRSFVIVCFSAILRSTVPNLQRYFEASYDNALRRIKLDIHAECHLH